MRSESFRKWLPGALPVKVTLRNKEMISQKQCFWFLLPNNNLRQSPMLKLPKETMSFTDELLENNKAYAASFSGPLPLPPAKNIAVLACMDARINVYGVLGLEEGQSHVIRNAGGVVTADEIRSLAISQRLLGTKEIILIHHTDCGMLTFTDDEFKEGVRKETGLKPEWSSSL